MLTTSDDGFRTASYEIGRRRPLYEALAPARPRGGGRFATCDQVVGGVDLCVDYDNGSVAWWTSDDGRTWSSSRLDLDRLLPEPRASLSPGVFAVSGGGDGATLYPFERLVRSSDSGRSWTRFDLPLFDGERAYSSGGVVTRDGSLVTLLTNFSDDRRNRPSPRHHGLYVSDGTDWSAYAPLRPRFLPALSPTPADEGWPTVMSIDAAVMPDPLIWVTTWDQRLYVSSDDAATFRELPLRVG